MAKSGKSRIPKTIGGWTVPKSLRRSKLLASMLKHPLGRAVVAEALMTGAAAAASVLVEERGELRLRRKRGRSELDAMIEMASAQATEAAMGVIAEAARRILAGDEDDLPHRRGGEPVH